MSTLKLHLPAGVHFECTGCGRCCRAAWTIAVEPTAEQAIRQSEAHQTVINRGYQPLVVVGERLTLGRAADNSCHFLSAENACEIHRELGGERKPLVCQTYPFIFTETPDGVYTSLSYACPAVLEQVGPLLEANRAGLERLLETRWEELPRAAPVGQRVEITRNHSMSWRDYLRLEERILDAFSAEKPVETLLGAAVHLILAEPPQAGDFVSPEIPLDTPYNFGGFDTQLASMVSCNLIAITEDVTDPEERARMGSLLWNGVSFPSAKFGVQLPPFQLHQPSSPQAIEIIDGYVRQMILGKRLLSGTVVSRLLALTCGMAILNFYANALTQEQDGTFSWSAMDRAFTVLESELLSHTRSFDGFFNEFEQALRSVRNSLSGA